MHKHFILYGAGGYAKTDLEFFIKNEIVADCFVDADESKHFTEIASNCGVLYDVLPFDEALVRYPGAGICVTSRMYFPQICEYLVSKAIPLSRIYIVTGNSLSSASDKQVPKQCKYIGNYLYIDGTGIATCCMQGYNFFLSSTGNIKDDIVNYNEKFEILKNNLNEGMLTHCTGCPMLYPGQSEGTSSISHVNISSGVPGQRDCNFKCIYCVYDGFSESKDWDARSDNVVEIMQHICELPSVESMTFASGEIGISPYRKEIIELWKKKKLKGQIFTNASMYIDELEDLINEGFVRINVSLDAGTAETFAKIKRVKCFEKVVANLERYAVKGDCIDLKYILLDGLNCDEVNIDGFLGIAKKLNAHVVVSRDVSVSLESLSEREEFALKRLTEQCVLQDIPIRYQKFYLSAASDMIDDRLWCYLMPIVREGG